MHRPDETQKRKTEVSRELDQFTDSLVDPILSIDTQGTILTANPPVERVFGWTREQLVGDHISVLMAEPFRSEHDDYVQRFLDTGERRAIGRVRQVLARHKDGHEFACELSVSVVEVDGAVRFYGIVRDVSDRERLLERVAQVERLAAVGELAAGVAHEVNNPVNTIINCAKLMKAGDDDPQLVDDIIDEGLRIAMIVRDLLDLSRQHDDDFAPVDLENVVRRTLALLESRFAKDAISVDVEIAEGLSRIHGRAHQMQQVLTNLLLNARDALLGAKGDRERVVSVRLRNVGPDRVEIRVHDNGVGIEEHDLERIFRPFYSKKLANGGTGLGLAVSRGIVHGHGGSIAAHSRIGEYAEFVI
ncbi:MAG: PAS domain S-box protein, partial [Planctomycetes bacterium]|nr:PAS domain S-box protein [Planctomycetota bacterium]